MDKIGQKIDEIDKNDPSIKDLILYQGTKIVAASTLNISNQQKLSILFLGMHK